jgi:hypothetical protein
MGGGGGWRSIESEDADWCSAHFDGSGGGGGVGDGSITETGGIVSDFIILARFCPGALSALPAYHQ